MAYILLFIWVIQLTTHTSIGFRILPHKDNARYFMNVFDKDNTLPIGNNNEKENEKEEETDFFKLLQRYRNNSGLDETYKGNETVDTEMLHRIQINLIKFALLKQLESQNIREAGKLQLLDENKHLFDSTGCAINITAGGLYRDWDFMLL
jgi:hypothetical protein